MSGWLGNWAYRRRIVIPASKIDDTLNNFPVFILFGPSDTDFHNEMSLGDGLKVACTSDDGVTQLYGVLNVHRSSPDNHWSGWVKVPQVDKNTDTVLYFYYDSSEAANSSYWGTPQRPTTTPASNVWDSNFISVWQFGQTPNPPLNDDFYDSTGNDHYGDSSGGVSRVDTDEGRAWEFNGSNGFVENIEGLSAFRGLSAITIEVRAKVDNRADYDKLIQMRDTAANQNNVFLVGWNDDSQDREIYGQFYSGSTTAIGSAFTKGGPNDNEWFTFQVLYTGENAADAIRSYLNGELREETSGDGSDLNNNSTNVLLIAKNPSASGYHDGQIFEIRVSDVARSNAWLKATHLNWENDLITIEEENSSESSFSQTSKSSSSLSSSSSSESSLSSSSSSEDSKSQSSASDGWLDGYRYRVRLTVDNTKVYADLGNIAVGVHISDDSGPSSQDVSWIFDWLPNPRDWRRLAFTTGDGVTRCYADVERWEPENNQAWIWVGGISLLASTDVDFYMYFDPLTSDDDYIGKGSNNSAADSTNVYNTTIQYVHHFNETPQENAYMPEPKAGEDPQMLGEWSSEHLLEGPSGHKAYNFNNGEGFRRLDLGVGGYSAVRGIGDLTVELLIKFNALDPERCDIIDMADPSASGSSRHFKIRYFGESGQGINLAVYNTSNALIGQLNTNWNPTVGTWYHLSCKYADGTGNIIVRANKVQRGSTSVSGALLNDDSAATVVIGARTQVDQQWFDGEIARIVVNDASRSDNYLDTNYEQWFDNANTWGALEGDVSESPSSHSWSSSLSSSSSSQSSSASSESSTSSSESKSSSPSSSSSSSSESSSSESISKSSSSNSSISSESSTSSSSSSESSISSSSESSESSRSKISDVAGVLDHIGGMGEQAFAPVIHPLGIQNQITATNTLVEPILSQITAINELSGDPVGAIISTENEISDKDVAQSIVKNLITIGAYGAQFQAVDWNIFLDGASIKGKIEEGSITVSFNEATVHNTIQFTSIDRDLYARCDTLINYGQPRLRLDIGGRTLWFLLERRTGNEVQFGVWGRSISALDDEPYATSVDYTLAQPTSAKEVAETIVQANAVDFQVIDWVLPVDFEFSGVPVEGLMEIADAIGGVLRSKDDGSFLIRRKYPTRPVDIPNTAADVNYDRVANIIQISFDDIKGSGWDRVKIIGYAPGAQLPVLELEESSPQRGQQVHLRVYWANNAPTEEVEEFVTDGLITDLGNYDEQKTETIVFEAGAAIVGYPITSLDSFEFIGFDAGNISATQYTTELSLDSEDLYAVATVTYTTTYQRYQMFDHDVVKLLTVLTIPTASDTSIIVQMGEGSNPSPRNIEQGLLTNEAAAIERGLAYLDLNRYDRRRIVIKVPYSGDAQDGNIAYLNNDVLGIVGNVHITAVEIDFKGPQITNRIEVELCLL